MSDTNSQNLQADNKRLEGELEQYNDALSLAVEYG